MNFGLNAFDGIDVSFDIFIFPLIAFLITFLIVPLVILFSKKFNVGDKPGMRKVHKQKTPTIGGISIAIGLIVSLLVWFIYYEITAKFSNKLFVFGGVSILILLIVGVRDDFIPIRSLVKLLAQFIVAFIVVVFGKLYISNLGGFLGIYEIPLFLSHCLSIFIILVIVNAYNLIDGIDGLATLQTIVTSLMFGLWFLANNNHVMYTISFCLVGALFGFLFFNFPPAKIFMGDTGSMLLGFILSILSIRFIQYNNVGADYTVSYAPLVAFSTMMIPLLDVGRVFVVRILKGTSPFKPDKNHIHHLFLKLGYTHGRITLILTGLSILFIILTFLLNSYTPILIFVFLIIFYLLMTKYVAVNIKKKIKHIR